MKQPPWCIGCGKMLREGVFKSEDGWYCFCCYKGLLDILREHRKRKEQAKK